MEKTDSVVRIHDHNSISVVIPVKNSENKIGKCLEAIFNQTLMPSEIIIVDGYSSDRTIEIASKFRVKILYENYGTVGGARQVGVKNAMGKYIAFTDADCIPEACWLCNLVKEFNEDIIGVGGGIRNIGDGLWEQSIALALDSFLGSANSVQDRVFKERRVVRSLSGCNSIYRRSDLIKVGGFDVSLSINEDTEINKRLMKLGTLLYIPNAIIFHDQERTFREFMNRMYSFGYSRGKNKLFDLQVIPPIMGLIVILFLFVSLNAFLFMISIYMAILIFFDVMIFLKVKKTIFLISLPITFITEHIMYTLGFWKGIAESLV